MEKRTILAIGLCIAVFLIWQLFFFESPKPTARPDGGATAQTGSTLADASGTTDAARAEAEDERPPAERPAERLVKLDNGLFEATLSSRGAALKSLKLAHFTEREEQETGSGNGVLRPEDLVSTQQELALPLAIHFRREKTSFRSKKFTDWELISTGVRQAIFRYHDPEDPGTPVITKTFTLHADAYLLDLAVKLENPSDLSINEQIVLDLFAAFIPQTDSGCLRCASVQSTPGSPMCLRGDELVPSSSGCAPIAQMKPGEIHRQEPDIYWTGINEQYFLMAAIPLGVDRSVCRLEAGTNKLMQSSLMYPETVIPPGDSVVHRFRIYAGPKQLALMEKVKGGPGEGERDARLTASVDYGWFSFLCHPMLWLLKVFFSVVGNYGVAIIFLTVVIKILLLPLTHKSMKSMAQMAKLKPLMEDLKKKHGDDRQKLNEEMLKLYRSHGVNPAAGCFPMLLQMPIWIALYRMLWSSVELYQAPFITGWLADLSYRDPYYIMPILLGLTMFIQQKLSPTSGDTQQAKMMLYAMPVMFTFFMLYLPSGLVLYIFVNTLLSIAHQMVYNRRKNKAVTTAGQPSVAQSS